MGGSLWWYLEDGEGFCLRGDLEDRVIHAITDVLGISKGSCPEIYVSISLFFDAQASQEPTMSVSVCVCPN